MKSNIFCKLLLSLTMLSVFPSNAASDTVSFVSCPIYRDTRVGLKSGCWLADDPSSGKRYEISLSPTKPDWNYQVLVEGIVSDTLEDLCGAVPLEPVRVSVLTERCPARSISAEHYPGRPFERPKRITLPFSVERELPQPPFKDRTFHVFFDLNKSFILYQFSDYFFDEAAFWLLHSQPDKIVVTGYADVEPRIVTGSVIKESPSIAEERAKVVAESLVRFGVNSDSIVVQWKYETSLLDAETPGVDGIPRTGARRVDISAYYKP